MSSGKQNIQIILFEYLTVSLKSDRFALQVQAKLHFN
jgi:hypothetical protein